MNTRNLKKRRGGGWAAVVFVPFELQELAAKAFNRRTKRLKEVVVGLDTRDLREANRKKLSVIARIQAKLATLDDPTEDALAMSQEMDNPGFWDALEAETERVKKRKGPAAASRFWRIATNEAVPLSIALEKWKVAATGIKKGTMYQYERDIQAFIDWSGDIPAQDVDEHLAVRWWDHLKATPTRNKSVIAPNTLNRKVGSLNRLWKWMKARKLHDGPNPWGELLQDVPGEAKRGSTVKELRAMTAEEAAKYRAFVDTRKSKYKQAVFDVLTLFWHTGIRQDDICRLTTDRVLFDEEEEVGWLTILKGKTESNTRVMPVVSKEAVAVLKRRVEEAKKGLLFHDVEPQGVDGKRWDRLQRHANDWRREALKGLPVDTYSIRRTFSGACEDAGLDPVQWSRMMGHTAPTLAAAVYNRGHKGRKMLLEGIKRVEAEIGELSDVKLEAEEEE
ncbi:tyrosine-type recombinase/integrase [Magnetospira sp. QH-2]|uniref:tyrosine-type recombinase/integrase n=1 Tax=Magnetospira sp. (strain QH-2) TaxID=1288970 RepID=UPI0003E80E4D|nr:tyrosine-type recombinase/integrase [Magnetospira sp. QH-2]CCQ73930.1 Putative phage integrase [Magnetospira sp. QH-2]